MVLCDDNRCDEVSTIDGSIEQMSKSDEILIIEGKCNTLVFYGDLYMCFRVGFSRFDVSCLTRHLVHVHPDVLIFRFRVLKLDL